MCIRDRLQPGASIMRDGQVVGQVTQVGYENGIPVAELEFKPGQGPGTDGYCVVDTNNSLFSPDKIVKIEGNSTTNSKFDFLDAGKSQGIGVPQLLVGLIAIGVVVGIGLFVMKVIQKSFFWIALAFVVIVVLYVLVQNGISLPDIPSDFSVPLPLEE